MNKGDGVSKYIAKVKLSSYEKAMTLSALVRVLVESFLPDMHQKYAMNNYQSGIASVIHLYLFSYKVDLIVSLLTAWSIRLVQRSMTAQIS